MPDKTTDASGATEATAPSERAHHAGDGGAVAGGTKRFSAKRKLAIVQRLLRGEGLETVSREENVPVHRLTAWRDKERWSQKFRPGVKVDRLRRETIRNDEEKDAYA